MSETEPFDILIRGATAITSDPATPMIADAAIGVRGDKLAYVGKADASLFI